jgi:hypothetical protein
MIGIARAAAATFSILMDFKSLTTLLLLLPSSAAADECRCSNADRELSERGNFNWCCNVRTPRLGVERHIDLSRQVFTEVRLSLQSCQVRVTPNPI